MQHGGRGAMDDPPRTTASSSAPPQPGSSRDTPDGSGAASGHSQDDVTAAPESHDEEAGSSTDDDSLCREGVEGGLVLKSCIQEKSSRGGGGFFHRLVGGKQQKYQVGNAAASVVSNLDSIASTTDVAVSRTGDVSRQVPPLTRASSDVMEDIPLHEDHASTASSRSPPSLDREGQYLNGHPTFAAPEVVIHDSPAKPLTKDDDAVQVGYRHPILHKQSSSCGPDLSANPATGPKDDAPPLLVLLTIVSAAGLLKVHKFGVQAPYLEMKISSDEASPFRTAECKKGGTEAVWNQTFTRRLHSLDDSLVVAAKASTTVIGELVVSFRSLGLTTALTNHTLQLTRGKAAEPVGTICMQCRVLDSTASPPAATPAPVAPLPPQPAIALPMPSCVDKPVEPKVSVAKVKYNDVGASEDMWDAAIRKGALMFKIPYHQSSGAAPKRKWVALQDLPKKGLCITWSDPQNPVESTHHLIALHDVVEVKTGIKTMAFRKQHAAQGKANTFFHEDVCFSLISASRSLDLAAASKEEAAVWVASLRRMLQHQTTTTPTSSSVVVGLRTSAKIMQDFKTAATTPIRDKSTHAMWMQDLFRYAKAQQLSEIAHFLMDGCPVDLLEPQTGDTILFLACRSGHVALLELCLKWGAKNDPHPTFGDTALQIAVKASQPECVRQLLSIAAKSDMDTEIVNHVDHANQAPLHVAASQGDVVCLQLLLHHGADICVVQANGHTPLHCAVLGGHESCVAYILDVGGDAIINTGDGQGNTPLHCAVLLGNERLVKLLLESAADVTVVNNDNMTPYKLARRSPKHRAIQALLAIYEPEPPPTPSKEQPRNMWQSTPQPQSARLQVRDALMKHKTHSLLAPSPAKSLSARSASEGEFDGYTSSSSTTSNSVGEGTLSSSSGTSYFQDYHHAQPSPYYQHNTLQHHPQQLHHQTSLPPTPHHHHAGPPSQQYPTYAAYDWQREWEVKYTGDGHAYYVNLYTGVSQWDAPPALQGYDPYAPSSYDHQLPAVPTTSSNGVYDSTSQYVRAHLAASHYADSTHHIVPPPPAVYASPASPTTLQVSTPSTTSATTSPAASPRSSKTSFSERRKMEGLTIEPLKVVTALPDQGLNLKLDKLNDEGDIFQKSRSRSPKGKSKTVKVLDIKRANNIVMTLSDFELPTQFHKITQAIVDMDDQALNLEKLRCLKGLFPTDDEKENLLARQADKGEFGKAEKFMMACLDVDDINVRADCFLFKLKFTKTMAQLKTRVQLVVATCQVILDTPVLCALLHQMLEDKKQKVMWEEDKYKQLLDDARAAGDISLDHLDKLRQVDTVPDLSCLLRPELQDVLDSLINGCRACQNLLSQAKARLKQTDAPTTVTLMGAPAVAEFERFIKASVGDINDATDEFRQAKAWENKLVSEFGAVLEEFSPHEILCAVRQLIA